MPVKLHARNGRSTAWTPLENELLLQVSSASGSNTSQSIHARWTSRARARASASPTARSQLFARTQAMLKERLRTIKKKAQSKTDKTAKNPKKRKTPDNNYT
jgi:hypothetical protein